MQTTGIMQQKTRKTHIEVTCFWWQEKPPLHHRLRNLTCPAPQNLRPRLAFGAPMGELGEEDIHYNNKIYIYYFNNRIVIIINNILRMLSKCRPQNCTARGPPRAVQFWGRHFDSISNILLIIITIWLL